MRNQRTLGLVSLTTVCLLSAAAAQAAIVTYQASGAIDQIDNATQLPGALSGAAVGQILSLSFTLDTSALGSSNGPGDTSYFSPVTAGQASIGAGGPVALGVDFSTVEITHNALSGGTYFSGFQLTSIGNVPSNFTGTTSAFGLLTEAGSANPLNLYNDVSLSHAPLQPSQANAFDNLAIVFTNYVDGVAQSSSDAFVGSGVSIAEVHSVAAPEIDPSSAAGGLTLLLGGLAVLVGRQRTAPVRRLG